MAQEKWRLPLLWDSQVLSPSAKLGSTPWFGVAALWQWSDGAGSIKMKLQTRGWIG
jgi:hypothetical protein